MCEVVYLYITIEAAGPGVTFTVDHLLLLFVYTLLCWNPQAYPADSGWFCFMLQSCFLSLCVCRNIWECNGFFSAFNQCQDITGWRILLESRFPGCGWCRLCEWWRLFDLPCLPAQKENTHTCMHARTHMHAHTHMHACTNKQLKSYHSLMFWQEGSTSTVLQPRYSNHSLGVT